MKAATTHKSVKIARLLPDVSDSTWPAHYLGYFDCFDRGLYYEAHDVLEELWLGSKNDEPYHFFKGLIQLAGSFVHIQKKRPVPALRLYELAWKNLSPYHPAYWGLDLLRLRDILDPYHLLLKTNKKEPLVELGAPLITPCFSEVRNHPPQLKKPHPPAEFLSSQPAVVNLHQEYQKPQLAREYWPLNP